MELKTPLIEQHIALGCTLTSFAGFSLPVYYTGIAEEHMAVRRNAGLFDISHMGEIIIYGDDALKNNNYIFTNDFIGMPDGAVRYSLICNKDGGVIDDLTVYRFSEDRYLTVPNAANRKKVFEHISSNIQGRVNIKDESDNYALIALQGPKSRAILSRLSDEANIPKDYYSFKDKADVAGSSCVISRTGYTGESGYEIFCSPDNAARLWQALLEAGEKDGLVPCGLGARDTLRLEAGMPLYGHELSEEITPFEAGLDFAVKMTKPDFIGKAALEKRGAPCKIRVGLKVIGRGIVREDCPVYIDKTRIGQTTSGTYLPYLGGAYAMAYINTSEAAIGSFVDVEVRNRMVPSEIVPLPFLQTKGKAK